MLNFGSDLFWEVAGEVESIFASFHQNIIKERRAIEPHIFVVEEKLGYEAQVFAIETLSPSWNLENLQDIISVDFVTWRVDKTVFAFLIDQEMFLHDIFLFEYR